jgi:hypothetical protein
MEGKMYRKETQVLITLISLILIPGIYALYVYNKFIAGNPDILNNFQFWGKRFMVLVPIMIVAMIAIHIIFAIINKIVTKEDIPMENDEMDKLIELKSLRISHWTYSTGFLLAMGALAVGMQPWVMFVVLISSCFLGGIVESIAKIIFYRKGI